MEVLRDPLKILVIQTAFIGDAVLTLPMIQQLKKKYPESIIDVLAVPSSAEIFLNNESVNNVIIYDKRGKDKSLLSLLQLAGKIRSEKYSAIFSPHRSFRSAILVLLSDVKNTYGFSNSSFRYAYKNIVHYNSGDHEVKRNLALAGFNTQNDNWRIYPQIKSDPKIAEKLKRYVNGSRKYVAIAPGSVWETKKYPSVYYKEIINYLLSSGFSVLLIGGDSDKEYCSGIKESFHEENLINTAGELSIIESIEVLKYCELLVCNDSAPTHFGMCAHIPVITIYCSTVPDFGFYPYNEKSEFISYSDLACKPCGIHGHKICPIGTFECAHRIDISQIKSMLNKVLANEQS